MFNLALGFTGNAFDVSLVLHYSASRERLASLLHEVEQLPRVDGQDATPNAPVNLVERYFSDPS
jgi:hypothetical protein